MNISDLKENDVVHCDWYVDHPHLVCKSQPGLTGLRLVPQIFVENFSETECNRKISAPSISLLEKTDWTLIGSYDPVAEEFAWKKFRVDLIRLETGMVWKRDHPKQIFNSLKEAEEDARDWDRFYKRDFVVIGDPSKDRCGMQHKDTCQRVWQAEVIPM